MVWPSRSNNYFPFHVRANKVRAIERAGISFLDQMIRHVTVKENCIIRSFDVKVVPRGENPSYPHHAYALSNENNNVTGVNTIEALKEAYREMVS